MKDIEKEAKTRRAVLDAVDEYPDRYADGIHEDPMNDDMEAN